MSSICHERLTPSLCSAAEAVLLGITALALGLGPSAETNTIYHRAILVVLVVVLALLMIPGARAALGRGNHA